MGNFFMDIKINAKKKIEGEKPIFDLQGPTQVTLKLEEDIDPSTSLYLAGSKVFKDSDKLLFLSTTFTIDGNEVTFTVDTYTENWLQYVNEMKTPFNLELGQMGSPKTIYLLDKVFGNPRVYLEGVPPANLPDYYTKEEADAKFTTKEEYDDLSGIVSGDIHNLAQNYWTKQEVAAAIADIQTMEIQVVQELPPPASAQEYTIYLTPSPSSELGNFYDEYLLINQQFELIGSTTIDMSQYARKDVDEAFLSGISIGTKIVQGAAIGSDRWNATNNTGCTFNYATQAGNFALAQGYATKAQGLYSHAEGNTTSTAGAAYGSHAEGRESQAKFPYSHVEGYGTVSAEDYQHVEGIYNVSTSGAVRVTGGGTNSNNRKNIEVLDWDGNLWVAGTVTSPVKISAPYIEATSGIIQNGVEYHLSKLQEKQDQIISDQETITLSSNVYIKASDPLSALTLTIPSGLTNSTIFFKTGATFTSTINTPENAYVNEDFDFGPSGAYILSVEDDVILWSELTKRS